jgi:predicted ATPase
LSIFNIDPHIAKKPVEFLGKAELAEDGKNLAIVLDAIITDPEKRRKFANLLQNLLPFTETVGTEKFAEKSLMLTIQEQFFKEPLRAFLLSDGTINITALIAALHFENKQVVFLEEPERNIHPHLASRLVQMMKEVSQKRQVIVTTHSPEIVKHAGIENLLLLNRDKEGYSQITRPSEQEQVRIFLQNEIGLDDLFTDNLLGA